MNSVIFLFATFANIVGMLLVYYSFGKKMDKQKRFMNTLITVGAMYIIVLVAYMLSSIGIEKVAGSDQAKTMMTIAFVPVNTILFIPIMIRSYMKTKEKKMDIDTLTVRTVCVVILAIVVLICEFVYFRKFQKGIVELNKQIESNRIIENMVQQNKIENGNSYMNENLYMDNYIVNEINEYDNSIMRNTSNNNLNNAEGNELF